MATKGFNPKNKRSSDERLPPGQYKTDDFPVLSLGPTLEVSKDDYKLEIEAGGNSLSFTYEELLDIDDEVVDTDIHCVTKWSKFDTTWEGISFDYFHEKLNPNVKYKFIMLHSADGYTTNLPIADVLDGKAWIVYRYQGKEIEPQHGGPVRFLVPHLYLWKSAKWVNQIEYMEDDTKGFWEQRGYHNYGDPWKEQRYS